MKLSDIKGERVYDVIADLIAPITAIAMDESASAIFSRKAVPEGMEPWDFFLQRLRDNLPALVKAHKDELSLIMATLNDMTVEEYVENLTIPKLIGDLIDLVTDAEFVSFFN